MNTNQSRIEEVKDYVNLKFERIDHIDDLILQAICYFSILDSFAQSYYGYKGKNTDIFCNFIKKYQNRYSFLEYIDPISLFYDCSQNTTEKDLFECLDEYTCYYPEDIKKVERLQNYIQKISEEEGKEKVNKHSYLRLLYQLRNKLVHEMNSPDGGICENDNIPHYASCSRIFSGKELDEHPYAKEEVWVLCMPISFIRDLVDNQCHLVNQFQIKIQWFSFRESHCFFSSKT